MDVSVVWSFLNEVMRATIALFIIVDPIGNVPSIITLTSGMNFEERRDALQTATLVAFALLLAFSVTGMQVLNLFAISISSFMVAGGILLLILAIKILLFEQWGGEASSSKEVGAVPIACPLLVGPGAITTTIVILQTSGVLIAIASALLTFAVIWVVMRLIDPIHRFLGETGSTVIARIMAMLLAAIGVQYVVQGMRAYLP